MDDDEWTLSGTNVNTTLGQLQNAPDGSTVHVTLTRPAMLVGGRVVLGCNQFEIIDVVGASESVTVTGSEVRLRATLTKHGYAWQATTESGKVFRFTPTEVNEYTALGDITVPEPKKQTFSPGLYRDKDAGHPYVITPRGGIYIWHQAGWKAYSNPLPKNLHREISFGSPTPGVMEAFPQVELQVKP